MSAEHPDENLSRGFAINSSSSKIHEGEIQGEPATQSFRKSEPAAVLWLRLLSVFVRSQTERRIAERTNPASRPRLCSQSHSSAGPTFAEEVAETYECKAPQQTAGVGKQCKCGKRKIRGPGYRSRQMSHPGNKVTELPSSSQLVTFNPGSRASDPWTSIWMNINCPVFPSAAPRDAIDDERVRWPKKTWLDPSPGCERSSDGYAWAESNRTADYQSSRRLAEHYQGVVVRHVKQAGFDGQDFDVSPIRYNPHVAVVLQIAIVHGLAAHPLDSVHHLRPLS